MLSQAWGKQCGLRMCFALWANKKEKIKSKTSIFEVRLKNFEVMFPCSDFVALEKLSLVLSIQKHAQPHKIHKIMSKN